MEISAYLLVRMLRLALGEEVFQKSMEKYLKLYGEKNSNLDQFWQIFNDAASAAKKLPFDSRVTVKQFMDSWSTKSRYPLFKVKRDYHTNMVLITQVSGNNKLNLKGYQRQIKFF